jgi:hypothetical protein
MSGSGGHRCSSGGSSSPRRSVTGLAFACRSSEVLRDDVSARTRKCAPSTYSKAAASQSQGGAREFNKIGGRGPFGRVRASHSYAVTTLLRLRSATDD